MYIKSTLLHFCMASYENSSKKRLLSLHASRFSQTNFFSSHFRGIKFKPYSFELFLLQFKAFKQFVKQHFRGKNEFSNFHELLQKLTLQDFKNLPLLYGKL